MEFLKASEADAGRIMEIIGQSQAYLKQQGVNQWQNNYPNIGTVLNDIHNEECCVLLDNGRIVGTVTVIFGGEKTYSKIYDGEWLSSNEYATIHRIAVDPGYKGRGLAAEIIEKIEAMCRTKGIGSIRVDTHRQNESMKRMLHKNGFTYCGIIYVADNSERVAFEKLLP
ncbi:MAG TPA: GNAT family N-acetyltransferase [Clostridia bacterium]|nr:GNAT family N-acetyltransferase [Clostridia bacterium]